MTPYERKRAAQSLESKTRRAERIRRRIDRDRQDLKELEADIRELARKLENERVAA